MEKRSPAGGPDEEKAEQAESDHGRHQDPVEIPERSRPRDHTAQRPAAQRPAAAVGADWRQPGDGDRTQAWLAAARNHACPPALAARAAGPRPMSPRSWDGSFPPGSAAWYPS